ncbi:fimbrial biogenesis outer membrane usher protein [Pseudomonas cichorii]|uniref:Fimbrial biogenesis outer membrane usher protein n=1 Tax=Pseudomonas lijiangensis TaxID=2995658 RepID=A0ABX8HXP3_9PSED|nr:fimbrial biogenesis outer membrane usher protein [Pseudomonas cichorii]MBX8498795.1 fimbrial biogenesis outer membrane usher protein [Pseudomonas lijiangensis]MBX8504336.1 fimbrial biogenesis outer membrane usher protein [Pseudomonas lijiangensis]MBX8520487.1 fimbrial biogenesis outer membrane usher protein [Pseudomonas cichorii]MBX8535804.1 fimbrial biogenesis outer membrane usher protein [Pseudomonas cichorii]
MEWHHQNNKKAMTGFGLYGRANWIKGKTRRSLRRCRLAIVGGSLCITAFTVVSADTQGAQPVKFNTAFIQGSDQPPDLQEFLRANSVLPGTYRVDVYVNRALSGRRDITFSRNEKSGLIEPCLSPEMLENFGLDPQRLTVTSGQECFDLENTIEFARIDYRPDALRLDISVPQAAMARSRRGYVSPELWDQGETAGFINYNFNGSRRDQRGQHSDQYYLGLRNGFNLGAWRLRNESSLVYGDNQPYRFRSNRTFAQRDITALKSQLTLGETFTDSQVFDSVRFKGAAIASDDGMLSDSERTYAPVIRGTAETNATVEVRQNGFMLYSGNVSPGPFEITDIYPSGSNGDLLVTIIEADGRRRTFTQAYASLPIMVPAGSFRYSLAAGQVDSNDDHQASPNFTSAAVIYGLSERVTGFGGLQLAEDYNAANIGAGVNTGLGAVSFDITHSISELKQQTRSGQSMRVRYANTLDVTNTTLAVAGYRYSTEQYRTLNQHVSETDERPGLLANGRARDRLELNVTQVLPSQSGSLSLTASEQRYWNLPGKTRQLYLSYNAAWRTLNYSVSVERNQEFGTQGKGENDNRLALSMTLPLGDSPGSSRLSFNAVRDDNGEYNVQTGLNGQVLDRRDLFYSVQAGHDSSSGSFGAGKLNVTTPYGRFETGYSQGRDYDALTLAASGSLVAHGGGINLGQPLGETFALVQVPEVGGARLKSYSNVETSDNGYAVLPYAQPYRTNWVSLDTRQLGADIELDNAISQIVPRRGAIPLVSFKASQGRRVQFELVRADASPIPLGASVEDEQGRNLAVVDPNSQALVLSEKDSGVLRVQWSGQSCRAPFTLPPKDPKRAYERLKVVCQ